MNLVQRIQGQGPSTASKLEKLVAIFSRTLSQAQENSHYLHFDLNAGSGKNTEVGCLGSPLIFVETALRLGRPYEGFFIDRDASAVSRLRPRIWASSELGKHHVWHLDNRKFIQLIPSIIENLGLQPEEVVGTVLADPNGLGLNLSLLRGLTTHYPGLTVIINWNSRVWNMMRKNPSVRRISQEDTLTTAMDMLQRHHWLVSEPHQACLHRYLLLVGSNQELGRVPNFRDVNSRNGKRLLSRLEEV